MTWRSFAAVAIADLLLAACAGPQVRREAAKPPPAAADFLATTQCPGALPTFVRQGKAWTIGYPCATPAPLGPTTPIAWMLQGLQYHSGDETAYSTRTVGIAGGGGGVFYDL